MNHTPGRTWALTARGRHAAAFLAATGAIAFIAGATYALVQGPDLRDLRGTLVHVAQEMADGNLGPAYDLDPDCDTTPAAERSTNPSGITATIGGITFDGDTGYAAITYVIPDGEGFTATKVFTLEPDGRWRATPDGSC